MGAIDIEPILQDGEDSVLLELPLQPFNYLTFPIGLVMQLAEFVGLGGFEEPS